jgi:hypothetical protein
MLRTPNYIKNQPKLVSFLLISQTLLSQIFANLTPVEYLKLNYQAQAA